MIVKFAMDKEQRERADILASANLAVFYEDKEGNFFTSDEVMNFMRDCDIRLNVIEKIESEKIGVFHRLELADYIDCMQFGEDTLRAFAIVNNFDLLVHVEESTIPLLVDSLEALGRRFFYFGASMRYIWCGFNTASDDHGMIRELLVKLYPLHGGEMLNSHLKR